jgi:hypothetical protein
LAVKVFATSVYATSLGKSPEPIVEKAGTALDAVLFPKKVCAAALDSVNVSAGVVVAVATLVVNNGLRFPALNVETVPPAAVPHSSPLAVTFPLASA